ncbi:MAG: beta-ribofuranosylaminobenzene 5'-phosphate synthase [Candidatus Altiarchaeota archaeon]|nr:beta-ribofuranosylaminobenzene 5'-phosphate synthase [Candidatus Altiarchaeota archaeon]
MKITITTPSRLHFTLIDLNGGLSRIDGSAGLAIERPQTMVQAWKSEKLTVNAAERTSELVSIIKKITARYKLSDKLTLSVRKQSPAHAGLGSSTQLYLAAAKAVTMLYGITADARELAMLAGRGGTSGIGVGAFDAGGFLVDSGHSYGRGTEKEGFLPSSYSKAGPAPVGVRLNFPDWKILLCIPKGTGLHGARELEYFRRHFPSGEKEAERLSRIILMKMIPSVIEKDLEGFDESIMMMNKARSFIFQKETQKLIKDINNTGGKATSMSSFGPAVFTFTDNQKTALRLKEAMAEYGTVIETKAQNHGATVKINKKT